MKQFIEAIFYMFFPNVDENGQETDSNTPFGIKILFLLLISFLAYIMLVLS